MEKDISVLIEIRDLLKTMKDDQQQIIRDIRELKDEQRKLRDEIRMSNIVLNNITSRSEIIN